MYPNTIEPIRSRKNLVAPTSPERKLLRWLSRYMFFLSLSALAMLPSVLSAATTTDTVGLVQDLPDTSAEEVLTAASGILLPEAATNQAERHPLERLRQTLLKNLLTDGLITDMEHTTVISVPADVEKVNGQTIPEHLQHKYNAIVFSYGVEGDTDVEIRISADFIMVGTFDTEGTLQQGQLRGVHEMALVTGR